MAKAKLANGNIVDLAGATITPGDGEVAAILLSMGDANKNGKIDVSRAGGLHSPFPIPLIGQDFTLKPETEDAPLEKVLSFLDLGASALAGVPTVGPGAAVAAKVLLGGLHAILSTFKLVS